mmetsp:Transcript_44071/g.143011  ORF Transcript_44071/g.143011 Transcript_44071/m.143011 type:complete len:259 (+) Transcript_44071:322-1098(+)
MRLRPGLEVHVALRVCLDFVQPLDVDVSPVRGDGARAGRGRAARRPEGRVGDLNLALGDREPHELAARRRIEEVALGRERHALVDGAEEVGRLLAVGLLLRAREHGVRGALAGEEAVGTLLGRAETDIGLRAEGVAEPAARAAAPHGARASAALGEAPAPDARDFIGLEVDEVILFVEDVDVVLEFKVPLKVELLLEGPLHRPRVVVVVLVNVADGHRAAQDGLVLVVDEDLARRIVNALEGVRLGDDVQPVVERRRG